MEGVPAQSVVIRSVDEKMRIELMRKVTETGVCTDVEGIRVRGDGKFIKLVCRVKMRLFTIQCHIYFLKIKIMILTFSCDQYLLFN